MHSKTRQSRESSHAASWALLLGKRLRLQESGHEGDLTWNLFHSLEPEKLNPLNQPFISSKDFHYYFSLFTFYAHLILPLMPSYCMKLIDFMLNALLKYKAN